MKIRAFLLPLALAAGFGGGAIAAQGLGNGNDFKAAVPGRASDESPGQTAPAGAGGVFSGGSAQMFAVVNSDGTLARDKGALSATAVGLGTYEVRFARDVTACVYTATIGDRGTGIPAAGSLIVALRNGTSNGVFVQATDLAGTIADRPFHLWVNC